MSNDNYSQKETVNFWTKDKPRVMGDVVGRPEAIVLLGDITDKFILDAGCGTGYMSRLLADRGARVTGVDNSIQMLEKAHQAENEHPKNIKYCWENISLMDSFDDSSFDGILSTGVLIHNDMHVNKCFLEEAYRLLKPEGIAVISVTHPSIFNPTSPARNTEPFCVKYTPLEDKPYNESQKFTEHYMDIDKNMMHTIVWHHTIETYINAALKSELKLIKINEPVLKKEHLLIPEWGTACDFPAYFQMVLKKVKT